MRLAALFLAAWANVSPPASPHPQEPPAEAPTYPNLLRDTCAALAGDPREIHVDTTGVSNEEQEEMISEVTEAVVRGACYPDADADADATFTFSSIDEPNCHPGDVIGVWDSGGKIGCGVAGGEFHGPLIHHYFPNYGGQAVTGDVVKTPPPDPNTLVISDALTIADYSSRISVDLSWFSAESGWRRVRGGALVKWDGGWHVVTVRDDGHVVESQ